MIMKLPLPTSQSIRSCHSYWLLLANYYQMSSRMSLVKTAVLALITLKFERQSKWDMLQTIRLYMPIHKHAGCREWCYHTRIQHVDFMMWTYSYHKTSFTVLIYWYIDNRPSSSNLVTIPWCSVAYHRTKE